MSMNNLINKIKKLPNFIALMLLRFYQACISPMFPGCCRFRPTCSEYAAQAFQKYNFGKAFILTIKRLSKCHPFGGKGYDPVPDDFKFKRERRCAHK